MDERQAQIKEGAGLEDSRINTEFLDFLSKWSTPFFVLLLVLAAGMFGYRKLEEMRVAAIDQAYLDYDLATAGGNPSPSTLALLGEDYMDTRSVGLLAKLDEADIYLNSARTGLAPGSQPDPLTGNPLPEDVLSAEEVSSYLASAGSAYGVVLERAEKDGKPVLAVSAAFGSAAVLGSQGDTAGAKAMYERARTIANGAGMPLLSQVATNRAAEIESLPEITIYSEDELPELPTNDPTLDAINLPGIGTETGTETGSPAEDGAPAEDGVTTEDTAAEPAAAEPAADDTADGTADDAAATPVEAPSETPSDDVADDAAVDGSGAEQPTDQPTDQPPHTL